MREFEDIPHTGGKVTFSNGFTTYEHSNPWAAIFYEIIVSLNGIVLCRGSFNHRKNPEPTVKVMIGSDKEGLFGYSCPSCDKYFRANHKVNEIIICPYCLKMNNSLKFLTTNQKKYIELYYQNSICHFLTNETLCIDLDSLISKLENNVIKLNEYEQRQQQTLNCESCQIKFDVIGVYASCPGCGKRNTLDHFIHEIEKIKNQIDRNSISFNSALNMAIEHYDGFGSDVKNILEINIPLSNENKKNISKINFQRLMETNDILKNIYGMNLFQDKQKIELEIFFQKRHLIAHNSSVVDEKYLKKTGDKSVRIGQKISLNKEEIDKFLNLIQENTKEFFNQFSSLILDYIEKYKK